MAHGRRKVFVLAEQINGPLALEAARQIDAIFFIGLALCDIPP